jgi:hypothetical protein
MSAPAATAAIRSAAAKKSVVATAIGALALLSYFQFPGHTWLQQDSQIYAPILEHQFDASVLRNDIVVQHPHVAFTLYDEAALFLRGISGQSFHSVLAFQQIATRALGIWGLYLMAATLGLSAGTAIAALTALTVAAICSLGAAVAGPAVLTFEYEPTPRAFAVPLLLLAIGLTAHRRYSWAAAAAAGAFIYHAPTTWPFLTLFVPLACWRKQWRALGILAIAAATLLITAHGQDPQTLFGVLTPLQEQLQRMRAAYVWVLLWPAALAVHWSIVGACAVAAFWRLRRELPRDFAVFALGLPVLGVLSVPVSWLLLDQWKWAIVPQVQPMRALLFTALFMQLLTACAGVRAAAERRWLTAFGWLAAAYLLPLQADITKGWSIQRSAVLIALALFTAGLGGKAPRFAPAAVLAAFFAIPILGGVVNYPKLHTPALTGLGNWARSSTSLDAVFLFPETGHGLEPGIFRAEALRAIYVDWKGGGQVNYRKDFATEWWFRWQQTMQGFHAADMPGYGALGIRFVVLPAKDRLPQAPIFQNAGFVVYELMR